VPGLDVVCFWPAAYFNTLTRSIVTSAPPVIIFVEDREQSVEMCVIVNHLNQHRQIGRELDETRRVNHAAGSKSRRGMHHGRTGEPLRAHAFEQRTRQRLVLQRSDSPKKARTSDCSSRIRMALSLCK
jgi:hypothetical protein